MEKNAKWGALVAIIVLVLYFRSPSKPSSASDQVKKKLGGKVALPLTAEQQKTIYNFIGLHIMGENYGSVRSTWRVGGSMAYGFHRASNDRKQTTIVSLMRAYAKANAPRSKVVADVLADANWQKEQTKIDAARIVLDEVAESPQMVSVQYQWALNQYIKAAYATAASLGWKSPASYLVVAFFFRWADNNDAASKIVTNVATLPEAQSVGLLLNEWERRLSVKVRNSQQMITILTNLRKVVKSNPTLAE